MTKEIYYSDSKAISDLFVGKSVVAISKNGDGMQLSDGTELRIVPNDGGCICGAGDYYLDRLNTFSNVIMSAEVKISPREINNGYWSNEDAKTYQLFVYSEGIGESIAVISGDDGNGYYGTGFTIQVVLEGENNAI